MLTHSSFAKHRDTRCQERAFDGAAKAFLREAFGDRLASLRIRAMDGA